MYATKNKLPELQAIISKMPLEVCCMTALPEFGVGWREVSRAVRNSRLPMSSGSVARVLCRHASKSLPQDELDDILTRLRLKLVATQSRTWHVIRLSEPCTEDSVTELIRSLPSRLLQALRKNKMRNMRPQVETVMLGELMYISVQLVSDTKEGSVMYVAAPPGEPVALVSSLAGAGLLRACAEGLGYKKYENANLYGRDVKSLLRINDRAWNSNADHLANIPEYAPAPVITPNGIDYTNKTYDEMYVDNIIGPDPPLLTNLNIKTRSNFFDTTRLDKQIDLAVNIRSDDVAKTLKSWVTKGAIAPTSDFFQLFHKIKSNKIVYNREDSE